MIARSQVYELIEHRSGGVNAGDTLQVEHDDVAIFSRQGKLVRVLQPGTYQVPPEFAAPDMEVFFVSTRTNHGEKFGGQLGAGLPVRAAFGELAWKIADPERAVVSGVSGKELGRFVAARVVKAVQHVVATIAIKEKGELQLHAVMADTVREANERLAGVGVEIVQLGDLQMR